MADFWSFTIVVGLLWNVVVPSRYIWREGTWHTPGNHPSSASRWLHTTLKLSLAANLRRSRRHTLLFPIDRDSLYNRPTHLLSALLHPQEFRGDMTQYPSTTRFHSDIVRMIIVKWTIFSGSTFLTSITYNNLRLLLLTIYCTSRNHQVMQ